MAYEIPVHNDGTRTADADLSAKQFYAVKLASNGKVSLASTAGERCYGILQNKPSSGGVADVAVLGVSKVALGGSVSVGDRLSTDANGKLVKASNGEYVVALALESGSSGETIAAQVVAAHGVREQSGVHKIWTHQIKLSKIANGDIVTNYTPGFPFKIEKFSAIVSDPATTGGKAATLNLEIGTTDVTGGSLSLTSANMTPLGAVVNASSITGNNTGSATDTISIEASSVTAFAEGEVNLVVVLS